MSKENEPQENTQTKDKEVIQNGIKDHRFLSPVMTTSLNADNVPEDYMEHLRNGGTKLER